MKPSLSHQAYEMIKREILTCVLEPGQQIVQSQLAERYQIGTTPAREALQRLVQEGFVQAIPRFGYTVSYVTLSDVREVYELRAILEPAAARLAAQRATEAQLEEVARTADFYYAYPDGSHRPEAHVHNADFHRTVANAGNNRRLAEQISRVLDEMTRIFHLGLDLTPYAQEMYQEHLDLVDALRQRDPDRAEQVMRDQIVQSQQRVMAILSQRLGSLGQAIQIPPANSG